MEKKSQIKMIVDACEEIFEGMKLIVETLEFETGKEKCILGPFGTFIISNADGDHPVIHLSLNNIDPHIAAKFALFFHDEFNCDLGSPIFEDGSSIHFGKTAYEEKIKFEEANRGA